MAKIPLMMTNETLEAERRPWRTLDDRQSSSLSMDDFNTETALWGETNLNTDLFQENTRQNNLEAEPRTSSPIDFRSLVQSSMFTFTNDQRNLESSQIDIPAEDQQRLLGEVAYQLDKRILSYVFQGQKRFYGFTVLNIDHKIIDVSTHPLTGRVDGGYRMHLSQRHEQIMATLRQHGFKPQLHPPFTEFIINTYGILKRSPAEYRSADVDLNDPDFLRRVILTRAPIQLQKDLLVVLTCLCCMAEKDQKPLLLWSSKAVKQQQ